MSTTAPFIIGIGEILWDMLPAGRQLGGAPANFAYHAAALGAAGAVVSRVGDDPLGHEILHRLDGLHLNRSGVSVDSDHPTGVVDVKLDSAGVPEYIIRTGVAWDFIPHNQALHDLARRADAICFGTLGQRESVSRRSVQGFIVATNRRCLRVFDINLRQHYYSAEVVRELLQMSDVLKLNDQELPTVMGLLGLSMANAEQSIRAILGQFPLRLVALTRGPAGSLLVPREGAIDDHPGVSAQIADTVGAGDAFTAALVLGMLQAQPLPRINDFANRLAAFVCSQHGATPAIPDALKQGG